MRSTINKWYILKQLFVTTLLLCVLTCKNKIQWLPPTDKHKPGSFRNLTSYMYTKKRWKPYRQAFSWETIYTTGEKTTRNITQLATRQLTELFLLENLLPNPNVFYRLSGFECVTIQLYCVLTMYCVLRAKHAKLHVHAKECILFAIYDKTRNLQSKKAHI